MVSALSILQSKRKNLNIGGIQVQAALARTFKLLQDEMPSGFQEGSRVHFTVSGSKVQRLDDGSYVLEIDSVEPQTYETPEQPGGPQGPVNINPAPSPS